MKNIFAIFSTVILLSCHPESMEGGMFSPSSNLVIVKGLLHDNRDGQSYETVKIGSQTWMAENLNYEANSSVINDKYGSLYDWETAKAACPSGWHLPSATEWKVLILFAGGEDVAGKHLKAKSSWGNNGQDTYGFAALGLGDYYGWGEGDCWWTASRENNSVYYMFFIGDTAARLNKSSTIYKYSVRCLQD
jgi:uncharacterized protein (TIGR02145 family)